MVSLVDIGKLRKTLNLRGADVEFRGLSSTFIVDQLAASNELRLLMAEKAITGDMISALIANFPQVIAEAIAFAAGKPDDPETITFALLELGPGEWLEIMTEVMAMTFPRGVKSFVDALLGAARSLGLDVSGWDQATKSPATSPSASGTDTAPATPGTILPANSEDGQSLSTERRQESAAS